LRDELDGVVLLPKSINNSQVVREVDHRSNRDLWWLLVLVGTLVSGLVLYAWPHLALRQNGMATDQMYRERERLVEENRKLNLEKASLENLKRVEAIAIRELGLSVPPAERIVVVEKPRSLPDGSRLAREKDAREAARN
jgi:cell division protein FtsL